MGMLNPMRDKKNRGRYRGGRRDDTCDHDLSRRSPRVKPPTWYELGWEVKVMMKKRMKKNVNPTRTDVSGGQPTWDYSRLYVPGIHQSLHALF